MSPGLFFRVKNVTGGALFSCHISDAVQRVLHQREVDHDDGDRSLRQKVRIVVGYGIDRSQILLSSEV